MTPVPIYARLDFLPQMGSLERFNRVMETLTENARMPPESSLDNHTGLIAGIDWLMQNSAFSSMPAESLDVALPPELCETETVPILMVAPSHEERLAGGSAAELEEIQSPQGETTLGEKLVFDDEVPSRSLTPSPLTEEFVDVDEILTKQAECGFATKEVSGSDTE